jgi:hypothetical protein
VPVAPPEDAPKDTEDLPPDEPAAKLPFRRFSVDFSVLGVNAALPEPTLGLELGSEWLPQRWLGVRASLAGLVPRSRALGPAEASFGLLFMGLGACPRARVGSLMLGGCLGLEWGVLTTETNGFSGNDSSSRRFLAGSAVLRARWEVGQRLSLGVSGGVLVPYDRERFVYGLDGERRFAFQMSAICPRVGIGAALAL